MISLKLRDSTFVTFLLILTSKYMVFSVYPVGYLVNIVALLIAIYILIRKRFLLYFESVYQKVACLFFAISFVLLNISKYSNELSLANAIVPTGLILLLMITIPFVCKKEEMVDALQKYSKFNFWLLTIGLLLYFLDFLGLISSTSVVVAPDHANQEGYVSLYNLSFYPSWINIHVSSFILHRFSGGFWEPGTLGLYLIFLITIELSLFLNIDKYSKVRIFIYCIAGLASLSLLFFVGICLLSFFFFITKALNKKVLTVFTLLIIMLLFVFIFYYDYLYQALLYRFDFDSQRGFVGNTRSGVIKEFWDQFVAGDLLSQLIGFGPYSEFAGDSTSIMIKVYQRGVLGSLFLILSFLCFTIKSSKYFFIPAWVIALAILSQFEGAIFLLIIMLLSILTIIPRNNLHNTPIK